MQKKSNVGGQLGLTEYHPKLFEKLMQLMTDSEVDYHFLQVIHIPDDISALASTLKLHHNSMNNGNLG